MALLNIQKVNYLDYLNVMPGFMGLYRSNNQSS